MYLSLRAGISPSGLPSVRISVDHNFYIYGWISKQFGMVVLLREQMCYSIVSFGLVKSQGHAGSNVFPWQPSSLMFSTVSRTEIIYYATFNPFLQMNSFQHIGEKFFMKILWKHVSYTSCILKSFYSHNSVVVCSFFEFGIVKGQGHAVPMSVSKATFWFCMCSTVSMTEIIF